jgi:hypothetical protein
MLKKSAILILTITLTFVLISSVQALAYTFFDEFNGGDADGWFLGYSLHTPWIEGNWRVEDGMLVQDQAGDGFFALVENLELSDQIVEVDVKFNGPAGYGGIMIWFQDDGNFVTIRLYPPVHRIFIGKSIDGTFTYDYYTVEANENTWYTLKVDADATSGDLIVYLDDAYLFTHNVTTPNRTGQTGVFDGNSGGYFDNFIINPLSDKAQCKDGGWRIFYNPIFNNQGDCMRYLLGGKGQ